MVLTLQVIFTRVLPMSCKVFSIDIQIAICRVASWKYLFFILLLSLLPFQVSSCNCYSFWNHLKEDSGIQIQTLTIMGYKTVSLVYRLHYPPHKTPTVTIPLNWSPQRELGYRNSKNNPKPLTLKEKHFCKVPVKYPFIFSLTRKYKNKFCCTNL